jgi:aspartate/methionine/tyrosine aminotransferase
MSILSKTSAVFAKILENLDRRFQIVKNWMQQQTILEWVEPTGGCVSFPRFTDATMAKLDLEKFYKILNTTYSTHVGTGHWFEQPKRYMRIGFGWPDDAQLFKGLKNIERAYQDALKSTATI